MSFSRNPDSQRGFTLIELSIVLVIIGLIIGGVLKGQEMINSARLKSQVAQIDGVRAVIYTFQDKYNALPGDFKSDNIIPNVSAANSNVGDGDGLIENATSTNAAYTMDGATAAYEQSYFWAQLQAANMVGGISNSTLPGKMQSALVDVFYSELGLTATAETLTTNHWLRVDTAGGGHATFTPGDARDIDAKYDDGIPWTGTVRVSAKAALANCLAANRNTNDYLTANTNRCIGLAFEMQ